jgi:hypothetical protein
MLQAMASLGKEQEQTLSTAKIIREFVHPRRQ